MQKSDGIAMCMLNFYFFIALFLLPFMGEGKDAPIAGLAQSFFPFNSIEADYDVTVTDSKGESFSEKQRIILDLPRLQAKKSVWAGGDAKTSDSPEAIYSFENGVMKMLTVSDGVGGVFKSELRDIVPEFIMAWLDPYSEAVILSADNIGEFKVERSGEETVLSNSSHKLYFDKNLLLKECDYLAGTPETGETYPIQKIYLSKYADVGAFKFPTHVKTDFFDKNGNISVSATFAIYPETVKFNRLNKESTKLFFPKKTLVDDRILGRQFVVTDSPSVKSKEDAIMELLEDILDKADNAGQ